MIASLARMIEAMVPPPKHLSRWPKISPGFAQKKRMEYIRSQTFDMMECGQGDHHESIAQ